MTLLSQPNSYKDKPSQEHIALSVRANGAGLKFANLDAEFSNLKGSYLPKRVSPCDLPSDPLA